MVSNTKTRNRPTTNGGAQAGPIDFSVDFTIPDPNDINSMRSRIVFPEEDDEIEDDDDFNTRVLKFRKRELLRELQEIKKLEQEAQNGQDDSDEDEEDLDDDDFDRRRLPIRGRR